jgi:hypothetical protein
MLTSFFAEVMRPGLASAVLVVLVLTLTGAPSRAQVPGPLATNLAPGQVRETIGQAATVVSTVHYQAEFVLICGGTNCYGSFPKPGQSHRLNLTRVTCLAYSSNTAYFGYGHIELRASDDSHRLYEYLPVGYSSNSDIYTTLNGAVDVQVGANQYIHIFLYFLNGNPSYGTCSATGTLDTLQ